MSVFFSDDHLTLYGGDCRAVLAELPEQSVHTVVTSPPYWGLRDYGVGGQLGLEPTPEEYVANMVAVFREVRRVLRDDGTLWLNLGDSYAGSSQTGGTDPSGLLGYGNSGTRDVRDTFAPKRPLAGLKPKDLVGIPWMVARALQAPYYTGTIRDERDRIWLAAMIDGEGCLFLHKRKVGQSNGQGYVRKHDSYGAGLEVANTSEAIVLRCMAIAGGRGSISAQDKGRNQRLYRWSMRSNECRDVVREVYPHLVAKQHQARLLLGCPSSGTDAERAHAGMISLHNGGGSDIDFPAPASMFEPGWYLRSDVIWSKLNPMPESVTDRPTKAHEYLFLLSKAARYFYDADAVREAAMLTGGGERPTPDKAAREGQTNNGTGLTTLRSKDLPSGRNLRSVWNIATEPYPGAHFATFPRKLVEPCVKAGTSERGVCAECGAPWVREVGRDCEACGSLVPTQAKSCPECGHVRDWKAGRSISPEMVATDWSTPGRGTPRLPGGFTDNSRSDGWRATCDHDARAVPASVLDPFAGSGTTLLVAQSLGRRGVGIDLNPEYLRQALARNAQAPLGLEVPE